MSDPIETRANDEDELSVDELSGVAGGLGDNTNCSSGCTSNSHCLAQQDPAGGGIA
jgi:hypothetical protein